MYIKTKCKTYCNSHCQNLLLLFHLSKEKHPELNDLYNKIYTKKDMSYWERLDKKVQEYANKNGFMYVIDEEPFLKNPTGKPIIINYCYHEKIRQLSKNK